MGGKQQFDEDCSGKGMGIQSGSSASFGSHLGKYHSAFRLYAKNSGEDIKEFFIRKCKIYVSSISLVLPSRSWITGEEIRCGVISEAIANIQAEVSG